MPKLTQREQELLTKFAYVLKQRITYSDGVRNTIDAVLREIGVNVHPAHEEAMEYATQVDIGSVRGANDEVIVASFVETYEAGYDSGYDKGQHYERTNVQGY